MNFVLTEEQRLIEDNAHRFLAQYSDSVAVRAAADSDKNWDVDLWKKICEQMGWQALLVPESCGGLGLGYIELMVVLEQTGRFLLCAPFLSSSCIVVSALRVAQRLGGNQSLAQATLEKLADGVHTASMSWMDSSSIKADAQQTSLVATKNNNNYILEGVSAFSMNGASADMVLVAARLPSANNAIALFVVPTATAGVSCVDLPTMDQTRPQANISFKQVQVSADALLADEQCGIQILDIALCLAGIALAAEQSGLARVCLEHSVAYAKERVQFGRTIASFQAIKHYCAQMMLAVESMSSASWHAAICADDWLSGESTDDTLRQVAKVAQSYCTRHAFECAAQSLQIHGGVGFTWEYDIHLFFKRAQGGTSLLGAASDHEDYLAEQLWGDKGSFAS